MIRTYETAKTMGIPPMAPASLGPLNCAITRMIAVIAAEARLFKIISMVQKYHEVVVLPSSQHLS